MTTGFAQLGIRNDRRSSAAEAVHDGDTISVRADGNIGVRLLGVDTPEVSFVFPGPSGSFVSLADPRWEPFLATALDETRWGAFSSPLPPGLRAWLQSRLSDGAARTHHEHAEAATTTLRELVAADQRQLKQDDDQFKFYLAFGYEVMDGYGRFLCVINRNQPDARVPAPRPPSYNRRLLERGRAFPYFIWPNVNPWNRQDSVSAAVFEPGSARRLVEQNRELRDARQAVQAARAQHRGVFDMLNPAMLEPFELRYLARREPPGRYVIDLSADDDILIHPQHYFIVPNPEDRLFVPGHFVPLFVEHGWKRQPRPA